MDIWDWVEGTTERLRQGDLEQQQLATSMRELPTAICDDEHERVDTLMPEAIALARRLGETWAELFLRHWNLQSRVLHRSLARSEELREAVDLLEFANRMDTRKCPQSVCVTQDLACCYSRCDGPGYVSERLAVADETLRRIDPSWPCFDCISAEYFSALLDDDRPVEGLAFLDRQQAKLAEHGIFKLGSNMVHNRADALLALARSSEALAVLEGVRDPGRLGESYAMVHRMMQVRALLGLGRVGEAEALHPTFAAILDTASHYGEWVLGLRGLIRAGSRINDASIGEQLLQLQRNLEHNGSRWAAADMAADAAELAIDRGARTIAGLQLADLRRLRGLLRRPAKLDARLATLEQRLAALSEPADASSPTITQVEALLRGINDDGLPAERALDVIVAARATLPDDTTLLLHEARVLRLLARPELARARLERSFEQLLALVEPGERQPEGLTALDQLSAELAAATLEDRDFAGFDRLLARLGITGDAARSDRVSPPMLGHLHRLRVASLHERGDAPAAERALRALLDAGLAGAWAHLHLADFARERGEWSIVLAELDLYVMAEPEPSPADWQRMSAATLLGRWDVVRDSMARLGLPTLDLEPDLEPSTPIDTDLGMVQCEFAEPDGSKRRYWTRRTSPCGGLVLELAFPGDAQHYGDRVVYDPTDLDAEIESESDDDERPLCFAVVAIVESAGFRSFVVRGWDPGEDRFDALIDVLDAHGFVVERMTRPGWMGRDPRASDDEPEVELPTLALLVALTLERGPVGIEALRDCLRDATKDWEFPLLAPELDDAAGDFESRDAARTMLARMRI